MFYTSNFRRKKYEKDLMNDAWIIDFSQIMMCTVDNRFASKVGKPKEISTYIEATYMTSVKMTEFSASFQKKLHKSR